MTVEFFPNKLSDAAPLGTWKTDRRMTIEAWLKEQAPSYERRDSPPVSVILNDEIIEQADWHKVTFKPADLLQIYREPKGSDPFSITFSLISAAKAVLKAIMPKMPGAPSTSARGEGDPLQEASAKGNKVKLGEVVQQVAGYQRIYGAYLSQPRRRFVSPRDQRVQMLLYLGEGEYDVPVGTVRVGETPLISLGADASFRIYKPGESLAADEARLCWYEAPEVAMSSTGSSGLELTATTNLTQYAFASAFQFNGVNVSIPPGGGTFPTDWDDGLIIQIAAPYTYTVEDGTGLDGRDVIRGDIAQLGLVGGDVIEIQGDNAGTYVVHTADATNGLQLSYYGGQGDPAVNGLGIGQQVMAIGPVGLRYRILGSGDTVLQVERIKTNGSTDEGWPGWSPLTTNQGRIQLDSSNLQGGYRGPFPTCPENEKVTAFEYSMLLPAGVIKYNKNGSPEVHSVTHIVEWRDMDTTSPWNVVSQDITGAELNALGYTYRVQLPYPMRAEVRARRVPSTVTDQNRKSDTIMWYSLYGLLANTHRDSYPGLTVMTAEIRGGDRLSAQSESQVSAEVTRVLDLMDGTRGKTRDIVPWCLHQLRARGYTDADFDMPEWQYFHNVCVARGDTYDETLTSPVTVKEMINNALACGFGELVVFKGLLRPVRDEPRAAFDVTYGPKTQTYSPQNMTKMLKISGSMPSINDYDGVDIEYFDRKSWAWETVECRWPGDQGLKVEKIKMPGFSDRTRAWRYGMRRRGHQLFRTDVYSWETELDGRNSGYLGFAAVAGDAPKQCQSSMLRAFAVNESGTYLRTADRLDWSATETNKIGIRRLDGTLSGPWDATKVDDYTARVDALDFVPVVGGPFDDPHILFGQASRWAYPCLITSSDPSTDGNVAMKAMPYDARVYTYDDQSPPS